MFEVAYLPWTLVAIRNQQNRRETCHLLWAAEAREEPELDVIEFYGLVTQKLQAGQLHNLAMLSGPGGGGPEDNSRLPQSKRE